MRDWKFVEEKFLDDVSGLCSQGTSCSQCEHGTLSMRSISMTIIFILQQSGSRQHSIPQEEGKKKRKRKERKVFLPIRYTLCNILAVNTNKAMREKIMTRYQPSFLASLHTRSCLTKCPVELSSVRAPRHPIGCSPLLSVAVNANIWWLSEIQRVGQVRFCSERRFWDTSQHHVTLPHL